MAEQDPVARELSRLAEATSRIAPPPGLEARILARLSARRPTFWDIAARARTSALLFAAALALSSLVAGCWQHDLALSALVASAQAEASSGDP